MEVTYGEAQEHPGTQTGAKVTQETAYESDICVKDLQKHPGTHTGKTVTEETPCESDICGREFVRDMQTRPCTTSVEFDHTSDIETHPGEEPTQM